MKAFQAFPLLHFHILFPFTTPTYRIHIPHNNTNKTALPVITETIKTSYFSLESALHSTMAGSKAKKKKTKSTPLTNILNLGLLPKRRRRRMMAVVLFSDGLD